MERADHGGLAEGAEVGGGLVVVVELCWNCGNKVADGCRRGDVGGGAIGVSETVAR